MGNPLEKSIQNHINIVAIRRLTANNRRNNSAKRKTSHLNKPFSTPSYSYNKNQPEYWAENLHNPQYVLKKINFLSIEAAKKISDFKYTFSKPVHRRVPKHNNKYRDIYIYNIIDEAVSLHFFTELSKKNSVKFSRNSYAYRSDASPHDAVTFISEEFRGHKRLFIAEFDFTNYFDSISHAYIKKIINSPRFHVTNSEKDVIFNYIKTSRFAEKQKGIPQGSALSLFIANLALANLDYAFEKLNISFVRFADDILIWSDSYEAVTKAVEKILIWCEESGVSISPQKSHGIRILSNTPDLSHEMPHTDFITFLNHDFYLDKTRISEKSISIIKDKVQKNIYQILLNAPMHRRQELSRLNSQKYGLIDKDYISLIFSLRRLIYSNLNESRIRYFLRDTSSNLPLMPLGGILPYFAGATDTDQIHDLDRWVLQSIYKAIKKRKRILTQVLANTEIWDEYPKLWDLPIDEVSNYIIYPVIKSNSTETINLTIPSFLRYHKVVNKFVKIHGSAVLVFDKNFSAQIELY
ncbi:reverse transcriptase domain-containing protein [Rothia sp. P4278]|uniref:reverse transcriptase domain-containing protein n=1 Tax=Rothia sp. P4278 TaxID=3402658 RepID=UPI003AE0939D